MQSERVHIVQLDNSFCLVIKTKKKKKVYSEILFASRMLVNPGRQSSFRYSVLFLRAFSLFFMHFTEENSRCQLLKSLAFMKKKKKEPEICGINTIKNNKSFFSLPEFKKPENTD